MSQGGLGAPFLELALASGQMGAWDWSIAEGTVTWSRQLEAIHGLEPGSFPGTFEAFTADMHPEDRQFVVETIGRTVSERRPSYELEYRIVLPDDRVRWLEARGRLFLDERGHPTRMLGVCRDVTERRRREDQAAFLADATRILTASLEPEAVLEQLARLAVPRFADWCAVHVLTCGGTVAIAAVAHIDPDKVAYAWELQKRFPPRLDAEAGVGHSLRTKSSLLMTRVEPEALRAVAQSPEHLRLIEELKLHSGMVVPLLARGRTLGAITMVSAESHREFSQRDLEIAEEFAARAALALDNAQLFAELARARDELEVHYRREQEARAAAEHSRDQLARLQRVTASLSGAASVQALYDILVTEGVGAAGADTGLLYIAAPGRGLELVSDQGYAPIVRERFSLVAFDADLPAAESYRTGELIFIESRDELYRRYAVLSSHKAARSQAIAAVPLASSGRCLGTLILGFDEPRALSDAERAFALSLAAHGGLALERARLYDETQRALRGREDLLAMVSHDLRGPLAVTSLSAAQLLRTSRPGDGQPPRHLESIARSAKRMERLIRDMLDFSAIDAGTLRVVGAPHAIGTIAAQAVEAARSLTSGLALTLEVEDDLEPVVCDRERVLQIFDNLLGNAIKFTREGGRIEVRIHGERDAAVIAVRDTGIGIASDDLPRIFERYWHAAERHEGRPDPGHGLGLYITKGLVEAHGGSIRAESRPGEGSVFTFTLPVRERAPR
jgi:PAS domain S-box-containing protein